VANDEGFILKPDRYELKIKTNYIIYYYMPQLDKELFTEYFFMIALVLLSLHSDYYVSENFLRLNSQ
jgi:hypothetical protein